MCSFYALSLFFLFLYALVVHYTRDCSCTCTYIPVDQVAQETLYVEWHRVLEVIESQEYHTTLISVQMIRAIYTYMGREVYVKHMYGQQLMKYPVCLHVQCMLGHHTCKHCSVSLGHHYMYKHWLVFHLLSRIC